MRAMSVEREIQILEERRMKLQREIKNRNQKIKELEIELRVYSKLKGDQNGRPATE